MALRADGQKVADNSQINPSCIFNYLGIKGVGRSQNYPSISFDVKQYYNALPWLMY